MKEIFKQIDKWLQEAKDNQSRHSVTGPEAFHRGEVSAYTKVGKLIQKSITQQVVEADTKAAADNSVISLKECCK